ncbi:hypothetical protein F4810DRAFT_664866 [Camillea tinctor]|nr:hypothetical protein F4810DRAFT_664866 [Camillea tinctor]
MYSDEIFGEEWIENSKFSPTNSQIWGLEIWSLKSSTPFIRETLLKENSNELSQWLHQGGRFAVPKGLLEDDITGTLRLLYHYRIWNSPVDYEDYQIPFTKESWEEIASTMQLPISYSFYLTKRRPRPPTLKFANSSTPSSIALVVQSPPFNDGFTSLCMSLAPGSRKVSGVYECCRGDISSTLGPPLLQKLRAAASHVSEPMLLPYLFCDNWIETHELSNNGTELQLRYVQQSTGLWGEYFRHAGLPISKLDYNSMHERIIINHAYLTNGDAELVRTLADALDTAAEKFEAHLNGHTKEGEGSTTKYDSSIVKNQIDYLRSRCDIQFSRNQRMLNRIDISLQVLYNLMQQEVAHETRRDSSAMKSIALLTMVFLPATAIATIMAPFVKITDDDKIVISGQFWQFWAVAVPVTLFVLTLWALWTQRREIKKTRLRLREVYLKNRNASQLKA